MYRPHPIKMMLKKKSVLIIIFITLNISKVIAQEFDVDEGPAGPPQTPIDNFLLLLFIGAIILGGYFIYKEQKKSSIIN